MEKKVGIIENEKLLNKLLSKLIKYQNAGKGHVFFNLSGHINHADIKVYLGEWESRKEPEISLSLYEEKTVLRAIDEVDYLFKNTPSEEEINEKTRIAREKAEREQYERLRKKFDKEHETPCKS